MHRLVVCVLLSFPAIHGDVVSVAFHRPCGQGAGVVTQTAYTNVVTRSRLECARMCAVNRSCTAFTVCETSLYYDCGLMDVLSPDLDCNDPAVTRQNCSLQVKYATDLVQPAEYNLASETYLSASCPAGAYQLPYYHVCYWAQATPQNASDLQHITSCQDEGGQLAIVPSESVMVSLESLMNADSGFNRGSSDLGYWLDIDDRETENTFVTQLGPAPWIRWRPGQPNDAGDPLGDQDCVVLFPYDSYLLQDKYCTMENKPLCYHHQTGDGFRHVYTHNLNSEFGNVTSLGQAIQKGADIRVLIHSFDTNVDLVVNVDYVENLNLIYALSVHNMEITGVSTRVILTASTTGELKVTRWVSGTASSTTRKAWMSWYATDKQSVSVFESTTPSESMLTSAIMNGSDIRVQTVLDSYSLHDVYFGRNVTGQFAWKPSQFDTTWTCKLLNKVNMFDINWNTGSNMTLSDPTDFKLLAGDPWQLVFSNDESGLRLYGWVTDLITYIQSGHRVKVIYDGRSAKVDTVYIQSATVSVMLALGLDLDDVDASTSSWTRTITLVSTSGTVRTYGFSPDSATVLWNSSSTVTVQWYVDKAVWTEVHRSLIDITDNFIGNANINDVFYAGQPFRIRVELPAVSYSMTSLADSVSYDTANEIFTAKWSRHFSVIYNEIDGNFELNEPVEYNYFEVTSTGTMTTSTLVNGQYSVQSFSSIVNVWWFSQPYLF
ncbi:uncharacterized protein LOC110454280 [Mizuhopecten yessoensis]|uniref:C-type lectin domain-containing protein n=1 Tax=Mizuhopecten yessoensis TaxID=6573 RepID=A0A210QFH0_MIZYE|nr:uncharacterized protein LOC110454280 [Mizuhopecten yessoensis]OWF47485.1 hypothetical protein KP79_PYT07717 [Mizuhopecten yessoensis]